MRLCFTLAVLALLTLTACSTPMTQRPLVSAAEIQAEQNAQHEAAVANPFPPIVEPVRPTAKMKKRLQAIADRIAPHASKLCYEVRGEPHDTHDCHYNLELKGSHGVNAYADGQSVVISGPMMVFASNDTHLAFVLAHELAHNIMEHPDSMSGNIIIGAVLGTAIDIATKSGGGFGDIGADIAVRSYSPSFEAEADYIALYILARAGYPIEQAPNFWRAMAQYEPRGIYARSSHPTTAERFVGMSKTIQEIRAKQRARQALLPNIRREG